MEYGIDQGNGANTFEPNGRKRAVVSVYEPDKVPEYGRKIVDAEWDELIRRTPPIDTELMFFYTTKVYDETITRIKSGILADSDDELHAVNEFKTSLQRFISSSRCTQMRNYNQACCAGKLNMLSCVFICIMALNQYILLSMEVHVKVSTRQYDDAFKWAFSNKVVLLPKGEDTRWSQMNMFMQIQALTNAWGNVRRGGGNESAYFVSILEDRLSAIITLQHADGSIDGYGKYWVRNISTVVVPSIEYIDDVANLFVGFYRSLFIFEKISQFTYATLSEGRVAQFSNGYKQWLKNEMYESVLADYVDDARKISIYYCVREGENERSIREKNGVRSKSIKWALHVSRSYKQITWMLQEHTYDKKGNVLSSLPRPWQTLCLKLNVFVNFMGGNGINFTDLIFVQEKHFWEKFEAKKILRNPFVVEVMGEYYVIHAGKYYSPDSFDDAMLIWFILMNDNCNGIYKAEKNVDLKTSIEACMRDWDRLTSTPSDNKEGKLDEDMDVVL